MNMNTRLSILLAMMLALDAVGTPPARIGLNFPFRSPETAPTADFVEWLAELGAPAMRQMTYNDVHWLQVEPTDNAFDYSRTDEVFSNAYGIHPLPTLYGISAGENDQTGLQVPWLACDAPGPGCGWNALRDSAATENYVTNTVARYRGVVQVWEVSNEMNTKTSRPIGLPVADFVGFMRSNHVWIGAADPAARVALPGLIGTYGFPLSSSTNWLHQFLDAGGAGSFDIAGYHDYNSWWTLPVHYDMVRAALDAHGLTNVPLWVTETGISSRTNTAITPRYSTEDGQAADVWRRMSLLFGKGAECVCWHTFYSSSFPPGSDGWDEFGVMNATGKKKSWHSLRLFIQKMEGFASASLLSSGLATDDNTAGGEGVWVVKFACADGAGRHVLWSPDGRSHTLTGLTARTYSSVRVVPDSLGPGGADAAFTTNIHTSVDGTLTLTLTGIPIVVEGVPPDSLELAASCDPEGRPVLSWPSDLGGVVTLEAGDTIGAGWAAMIPEDMSIETSGGMTRATDLRAAAPARYYRLRWTAP